MTYLQFLLIFLFPPLTLGAYFWFKSRHEDRSLSLRGAWLLVFLAVIYTTPWDNYLVKTEVWTYGLDRVIATIGYVPVEEYAFFVLQTLMTSSWIYYLHHRSPIRDEGQSGPGRWLGAVVLTGITAFGFWCLRHEHTQYLGLILAWATPVALLQWVVGGHYLLNNLRLVILGIGVPTVYLWIADGIAIHLKIWEISETQTVGWKAGPLPLEEAVFFLMTNIMVTFGLTLFIAMKKVISVPILNPSEGRP